MGNFGRCVRARTGQIWRLVCVCGLLAGLWGTPGCGPKNRMDARDAAVLEKLSKYNPEHELDGKGRVWRLKLEGPGVVNEALEHARDLDALKSLSLYASSITDDGLANLLNNTQLEEIGLVSTRVSDRGLQHLARIPSLQRLWVSKDSPPLTRKGIDSLKKSLPGLTVYEQ